MTLNDLRVGWRTLVGEPAYSMVVVGGLAVGLAACLLLLGFVRYSWLYNTHVPEVERVYVVKLRHNTNPDAPWFDQAQLILRGVAANTPGVTAATGYLATRPIRTTARIDGKLQYVNSLTVLPGFVEMLGVGTVRGDLASALARPEGMAITDAVARRLYGSVDVLGKEIKVEGRLIRILAVVTAPPSSTTVPFETLVGVNSSLVDPMLREEMLTGSQGWWAKLLVKVKDGASVRSIEAALQRGADAAPFNRNLPPDVKARLGTRKPVDIKLSPLRYAYFDQENTHHFVFSVGERASPFVTAGLGVIGVLVLGLAAINYVNLATVRVLRRQREIALRKVLGGGTRQLALQFLAESQLVAFCASALGLLLAWLAEPLFAALVARTPPSVLGPANLAMAVALAIMLGLATAAYPAWIALRVRPAQALSGRPDSETAGGMRVRQVMTVTQVAVGMSLAAITLAVGWQTSYATRLSPGFDPAPLVGIDLPEAVDYDQGPAVRGLSAALAAQPEIAGVVIADDAVGRNQSVWQGHMRRPGQSAVPLRIKAVGASFFNVYGLKPVAGRLFTASLDRHPGGEAIVINAIAARQLGFASLDAAVGQRLEFVEGDGSIKPRRIVGIAPEVRFNSLHAAPAPVAYQINDMGLVLTVRATGSVAHAERVIRSLWPVYFPEGILTTHRPGDIVAANYAQEARLAQLLGIASGIALAIAAFGTYALAAHTVQRRAKEIVLRKLYGAGAADIGRLVTSEIGALAGIAALIALPVGAMVIYQYLSGYVEQARPAAYWALGLALAATLVVVGVAAARHALAAMHMRPAAILRN